MQNELDLWPLPSLDPHTLLLLTKCQLEFQSQRLDLKLNWSRIKLIILYTTPAPPGSLSQEQCHHPLTSDNLNYSPWSPQYRDCYSELKVDWLVVCNQSLTGRERKLSKALCAALDCGKVRSRERWEPGVTSQVAQEHSLPRVEALTLGTQAIQALKNHCCRVRTNFVSNFSSRVKATTSPNHLQPRPVFDPLFRWI